MRRTISLLILLGTLLFAAPSFAQLLLPVCPSGINPCSGQVQAPIDQNGWQNYKIILTQNITFSFNIIPPTPPPAQSTLRVIFTENAIGGFTVTFGANISNACSITTAANATTVCQFTYDGTSGNWLGITAATGGALNGSIYIGPGSYPTLASAVSNCISPCSIVDNTPETFAADPFAGAAGKNISIQFGPGTWTLGRSGTYGMTLPSNVGIFCQSPAAIIKAGNATNYVYDISVGGFAGIDTVNNAAIDNCTLDGNMANNTGGSTTALVGIGGGFNGGGNNRITRNIIQNAPSVGVLVTDDLNGGTYYPSQGDLIADNVFPVSNGVGTHAIEVKGTFSSGGEFFYTRILRNRIHQVMGFGIEIQRGNGVLVSENQVDGLTVYGTVNTQNASGSGCASNLVTFTSGTTTGLIGAQGSILGNSVKINGTAFFISSVVDSTHLCTVAAPGTQNGVAFAGGSLELLHHDTPAYGETSNNIIRNGSDNCISVTNQTSGQAFTSYKIIGNHISNCGANGIGVDSSSGTSNIIAIDIANNHIDGAHQGGTAEASQYDSAVRIGGSHTTFIFVHDNWFGDTAGSPTMLAGVACDISSSGSAVGFNIYYNTVSGITVRSPGNCGSQTLLNGPSILNNQQALLSYVNGGQSPYNLIYGDGNNAVHLGDQGRPIVEGAPQAVGTAPTLSGTGACATTGTQVGGIWNGRFVCTGTTGASTVTLTFATYVGVMGWNCTAFDRTTRANLVEQTSDSATTCVLTATSITQNDVIQFTAAAY